MAAIRVNALVTLAMLMSCNTEAEMVEPPAALIAPVPKYVI